MSAQPPNYQQVYPPQQGYPPPQEDYLPHRHPPQHQAYHPQDGQTAYPPQQGYPPQQAYTPQQGYPPQQVYPPQPGQDVIGAPPLYTSSPQNPQYATQQQTTSVVVVQQPQTVLVQPVRRRYGTGNHGLVYAIAASACIFFSGGWCGLFCTIAAIFVSISAQDAEHRGDNNVNSKTQFSIVLSSIGLTAAFISWIAYFICISRVS